MIRKRFIFHFILIFIFFLIEITIARTLPFPGAYLSLILVSAISLFLLGYQEESFWWFLIGGLLLDINSTFVFGLNTGIFLVIYFAISFIHEKIIHQPNVFLLTGILSASVLLLSLSHWLMLDNKELLQFLIVYGQSLLINFLFIWLIYLLFIYLSSWLSSYNLFNKE